MRRNKYIILFTHKNDNVHLLSDSNPNHRFLRVKFNSDVMLTLLHFPLYVFLLCSFLILTQLPETCIDFLKEYQVNQMPIYIRAYFVIIAIEIRKTEKKFTIKRQACIYYYGALIQYISCSRLYIWQPPKIYAHVLIHKTCENYLIW